MWKGRRILGDLPQLAFTRFYVVSPCTEGGHSSTAPYLSQKQRAAKRTVKREKREAAQREAQKAAEAFLQVSPRKVPGRVRGTAGDSSTPNSRGYTPPPEVCDFLSREEHCTLYSITVRLRGGCFRLFAQFGCKSGMWTADDVSSAGAGADVRPAGGKRG